MLDNLFLLLTICAGVSLVALTFVFVVFLFKCMVWILEVE